MRSEANDRVDDIYTVRLNKETSRQITQLRGLLQQKNPYLKITTAAALRHAIAGGLVADGGAHV